MGYGPELATRRQRQAGRSPVDPGEVLAGHEVAPLVGEGELHLDEHEWARPPFLLVHVARRFFTLITSPATTRSPSTTDVSPAMALRVGSGGTSARRGAVRLQLVRRDQRPRRASGPRTGTGWGRPRPHTRPPRAASLSKWMGLVSPVAWANLAMSVAVICISKGGYSRSAHRRASSVMTVITDPSSWR